MKHRADAYCAACGGTCRDPRTVAEQRRRPKPLSLGPLFTDAGAPSFKPARHGVRSPGK